MGRYLASRLISCLAIFFAVTFCVFAAFAAIPQSNRNRGGIAYRAHGSVPRQYEQYVWRLVRHGDLGYSYANREPVPTGSSAPCR